MQHEDEITKPNPCLDREMIDVKKLAMAIEEAIYLTVAAADVTNYSSQRRLNEARQNSKDAWLDLAEQIVKLTRS